MKPKLVLTVTSIMFLLLGLDNFFSIREFNFPAYIGVVFTLCLVVLFWLTRNAPASKTLDAVFIMGFLAFFLGAILAFYAQWSGNYIDSPLGYLEGVAWLAMAIWFFLVGRANMSTSES